MNEAHTAFKKSLDASRWKGIGYGDHKSYYTLTFFVGNKMHSWALAIENSVWSLIHVSVNANKSVHVFTGISDVRKLKIEAKKVIFKLFKATP